MKLLFYSFLLLLALAFNFPAQAQHKLIIGKEPAWVIINKYDYNDISLDHDAEDGFLDALLDEQISLGLQSHYFKKAVKIITEAGIQNSSEISVSFDPSYEQLTFHTLRIIRGNATINCLQLSKFKTIQQEKELSMHVYDGSLSSIIFLEDVRKGDIIEYSYTLKGFNPIFNNKYTGVYDLNYTVPVGLLSYRLTVPKGRQVYIKNSNTSLKASIQESFSETIYEWRSEHVNPLRLQDNVPGWYDPYSCIFVSEYKSWKEVNDWAVKLFPAVTDISPDLRKKIADIRASSDSVKQQVLSALRFVQDDVRYMGIEMGENSHRPFHPNKIFAQRFGDCKDKAYLLCTILNSLGIEASPVLINTTFKKTIEEWLPSPGVFDHTTVRVRINDKYYWLDATLSLQRGSLDLISYPDYQCGLVVHPDTRDLARINIKEPGSVVVQEIFNIRDMLGEAKLEVITHYKGSFADDTRYYFNNNSRYEIQKTYREYYAHYYTNIMCDSFSYDDEERTGELITREFYTIDSLWELKDGVKKVFFDPYVIDGVLRKPKDIKRTMPFSIMWPANYREEIEINLPEQWSAEESFTEIKTHSFNLTARFYFNGSKTIRLLYDYENLHDHVEAADIKEYMNGLDKRDKELTYMVSYSMDKKMQVPSSESNAKKDGNYTYIAIVFLLIIGTIVWRRQRR